MIRSRSAIAAGLLLGLPALAQEGANVMVPTIPGMFGIDTCGAFLCGTPATVPNGSKRAVHALEAAFRSRVGPVKPMKSGKSFNQSNRSGSTPTSSE